MKKNNKQIGLRVLLIILTVSISACNSKVRVSEKNDTVTVGNTHASIHFNISSGKYDIVNKNDNSVVVKDASLITNNSLTNAGASDEPHLDYDIVDFEDCFGKGKSLVINVEEEGQISSSYFFNIYDNQSFITITSAFENKTDRIQQIKSFHPVLNGQIYPDVKDFGNFAMVDGFSGGEPLEYGTRLYSPLTTEYALKSRNNILVSHGKGDARQTLLMGGLTYYDFEKNASLEQARRTELQHGSDSKSSLLCYLNLPDDTLDRFNDGPVLELLSQTGKRTWDNNEFRCTETATSAFNEAEILLEAKELDPDKEYYLGFSWWRGMRHGNRKDHRQSVAIEFEEDGELKREYLVENEVLPRFDGQLKEDVRQVEIALPSEAISAGEFRIIVEKTPDNYENSANDPNAYLSEIWLRDGSYEPLLPDSLTDINDCTRPRRELIGNLYASDPVGKRVDPGAKYVSQDKFYIDFSTKDPLIALEKYGLAVKEAQDIDLSMYDFPSVCLWYAEHSGYGGGKAENTTLGAVNEMKLIRDKGFLNYSRAAVRLVPDSYLPDNQQGWWDDEHWQMEETDRNASENGRYVEPYETSEKWGKAVTELGGIPLTYFQAGFRSEDYAKAFPGHMLFNKSLVWRGTPQDDPGDLFTNWNKTWTRNRAVWGFDYTDPGFLKHLEDVYRNLASGGVKGLMFDYPGYAWSYKGGFENEYATATEAYRNIFRKPFEGLGPGSYVHERNMERGTDISIGYVASMRTENDTDKMDATTVTRCGMRWYKNRVLYNQDTDSKNIAKLQDNQDVVRTVLTMAYVTTGRFLLANSFDQFTPQTLRDITRTFPYHTQNKSARPADAFVSEVPMVYDYEIDDKWHQVTFFNPDDDKAKTIGIDISGEPVDGALALEKEASYHIYDFWNDNYVGQLNGSVRLEQELRPGESRMLSVRKVVKHPQVISTDRHIMQGYLDLADVQWDNKKKELSGVSKVVGGDPYVISIAGNGIEHDEIQFFGDVDMELAKVESGIIRLSIKSEENAEVEWKVRFK